MFGSIFHVVSLCVLNKMSRRRFWSLRDRHRARYLVTPREQDSSWAGVSDEDLEGRPSVVKYRKSIIGLLVYDPRRGQLLTVNNSRGYE